MPRKPHDFWPARIEMKVQRPTLEFAQRFVIEIARDVTRQIADDEPHDLILDPATAPVHGAQNAIVDLRHR